MKRFLLKIWIEHSNLKLDKLYTYLHHEQVAKGARVIVDFNHRLIMGFCGGCEMIELDDDQLLQRFGYKIKAIHEVVDHESLLNEELFALGQKMAHDTLSPTISCFQTMLPSKIKPSGKVDKILKVRYVKIKDGHDNISLTTKQLLAYSELDKWGKMPYSEYRKQFKSSGLALIEKGIVECFELEKSYDKKELVISQPNVLNAAQQAAFDKIIATDKDVFLLHGVTGSGKTEVYLALAHHYAQLGRQVIILVPEISLTQMMIKRCQHSFGDDVAIYHSGLNDQEKYEQYQRVKKQEVKVVVGTRSAIFMPFDNIGLIVMDEEHDQSYKQDNIPCYHTKDIALARIQHHKAKLLLASATPSFESYARALKQVYELVELPNRFASNLPTIEVVNMQNEKNYLLSNSLKEALQATLDNHKQAIILLNRRGYSYDLRCKNCHELLMCHHCEMTLSYHADIKAMMCHSCSRVYKIPYRCPVCHSEAGFEHLGYGTQKVEEMLEASFPQAKILRMDKDTTRNKNAHASILDIFAKQQADILLGTQMIAKGLDFPNVELVGIINADEGLKRSDYRSVETTFELLVQASGRSGRATQGKVIMQVYDPDHYAIQNAIKHDYIHFFYQEMQFRHLAQYPPYSYLVAVYCYGLNEQRANDTIDLLASLLDGDFKILGPTKLLKIKDEYRYRLIIKGKDLLQMIEQLNQALATIRERKGMANIKVDVNPMYL
ncbi:MAG: primosomal protein N' [Erysipelotrichaceae bacterium]|nr:primosomal protein N' [Erysipelotrichaceae bacterium]MDY5252233.1 primosomal protein N' [Erysipelotrichaceae bacterium]